MTADNVTACVRRAFATERLQSAWRMLQASEIGDKSAAIEGVSRLLEARGLNLDDVLTSILSLPLEPENDPVRSDSIQETIYAPRPASSPSAPTELRTVSGRDVPERIAGRVHLLAERKTRTGPELKVSVVAFDVQYSPLAAKSEAAIAALKAAAYDGGLTQIIVKVPASSRQIAVVERVALGIAI